MRKKMIALLLCLLLGFGLTACNGGGQTNDSAGEIEFWSTYATEKILQDGVSRNINYDSVKMAAAVNVEACKGEYEGAQVIMTAKTDVAAYNAEITADLTGAGGAVFSKGNIALYHQKYITVSRIWDPDTGASAGRYPDALVPLESIIAVGENNIQKGENQGLYLTFNVPADQAAGVYTGSMKITYDKQEKVLPVTLTVYDLTVNQETRTKSYFNLGFTQHLGELDSTQNSWRKYVEELAKYRISASLLIQNAGLGMDDARLYANEAYDLCKNFGLSTINMPHKTGEGLTNYIVALAEKSVEENYDLVSKIIVKGPDEPDLNGQMASVIAHTSGFRSGVNSAVSQIEQLKTKYPEADSAFIAQLKASAQAIPSIIALSDGKTDASIAAGVDTYCPKFDFYDTAENRAMFDDQWKGKWFYGCIGPRAPYPTYHTEDTIISARSVGWMMSEYDVVGNLYWAVAVYSQWDGTAYQPIDDYYTGDAERFNRVNGDGYLFYPGAHYGIFGPVGSLRLEAIRDGNEDYELLYDLKEAYLAAGFSAEAVQRNISSLIYNGTRVASSSERFAAARKALIQLSMLAKSPAGVCITDVRDDNKGTVNYEIFVKDGYTLKNHGEGLTAGITANGGTKYALEIKLENARNSLALSVEADGKEYRLDYDLGGKAVYYSAAELLNEDNVFSNGSAEVNASLSSDKIELNIGPVSDAQQYVQYTSAALSSIDAGTKRFVLHIENTNDPSEAYNQNINFRIYFKFKNEPLYIVVAANLRTGMNLVSIDIGNHPLAKYGKIEHVRFYFGESTGDHGSKTFNIEGLTIYAA